MTYREKIILIIIILLALLVRFYNFTDRITYGPEQAISLISASDNFKTPSLLGIPYLIRVTDEGHRLFTSPIFGYSLIPLLLAFEFDPVPVTGYFALLNIFSGVLFFLLIKRIFNIRLALICLTLFLFNSVMIYHSMFIWTSNYMPLIGLVALYLLYQFYKKRSWQMVLLLGITLGIGFGIQYFFAFSIGVVVLIVFYLSKKRLLDMSSLAAGFLIGQLPTVIFDLKHGFYHLKTLFAYFSQTFQGSEGRGLTYYHLLSFWPLGILIIAVFINWLGNRNKMAVPLLLAIYIYLNLFSNLISFSKPVGMSEGLNWNKVNIVSRLIAADADGDFNLATLLDFDTRGHILRYPVEYLYKKVPLGVEEYPNSEVIYVLSRKDYNFEKPEVWELKSRQPYKYEMLEELDADYAIYKIK